MTFDFSLQDEVKINMTQYILKLTAVFPKEMLGKLGHLLVITFLN
jgi:hypothetical protein